MEPIPEITEPGLYLDCDFVNSGFVELVACDLFDVHMQYPLLQMKHAEKKCFVREEVLARLEKAALMLPKGYRFRIWDAWRPFALQRELYIIYSHNIIREFKLEKCTDTQKRDIISKFVSDPVDSRNTPPVHTTGGAVDLTILNPEGIELDMGSGFDEFTSRTYTVYYEDKSNEVIKENRRLLYNVMIGSGFTNLPSEWWHFDFGDRFWAYYNKRPAMYNGVFIREEMHESV